MKMADVQFQLAREYGFAGWQDLTGEVEKRLGSGLDWAVAQAARIIHDNDVEGLKQLVTEYPALLSWHGDSFGESGGLLGFATDSYGDSFAGSGLFGPRIRPIDISATPSTTPKMMKMRTGK